MQKSLKVGRILWLLYIICKQVFVDFLSAIKLMSCSNIKISSQWLSSKFSNQVARCFLIGIQVVTSGVLKDKLRVPEAPTTILCVGYGLTLCE
jgi:hypothetical protein